MFVAALPIITPMPISSRVDKGILVYPHNMILYSNQNEQTATTMNVICKMLYKKKYLLNGSIYMKHKTG